MMRRAFRSAVGLIAVLIGAGVPPRSLLAAAFEPLGYGAPAQGMGGAYVALAEDGTAAYWNPAGLARVKTPQITASMEDVYGLGLLRYAAAGYTHPNIGRGTLGAHLLHLDTTGDATFFNYAESTYLLAYGVGFRGDSVNIGLGMRYYNALGGSVKGTGLGYDAGVLWRPSGDRLRVAVSWQDLNRPRIGWSTGARDNLPSTVRGGAAVRLAEATDVALECDKRTDEPTVWRAGLAYRMLKDRVTLRTGAHRSGDQNEWGVAVGGGLRLTYVDVDYAWDNQGSLGNTQTLSLAMRFGK